MTITKTLDLIANSFIKNIEKPLGINSVELEYTKIDYSRISSILVIQFSALGDVVITNQLLQKLCARFKTYILTFDNNAPAVISNVGIISVDGKIARSGVFENIRQLFDKIIQTINSLNFDLIINLHPSEYSARMCEHLKSKFFLGQKFKSANDTFIAHFDLSHYLRFFMQYFGQLSKNRFIIPLADLHSLFAQVKYSANSNESADFIKSNYITQAQKESTNNKKDITIIPGGKWQNKRWHYVKFSELINKITNEYPEFKINLTGDKSEVELLDKILNLCVNRSRITVFAGSLKLPKLTEIIGNSAVVITNDTAPLHIANYKGTPTILLIGPTLTVPVGNAISIIGDTDCNGCLNPECARSEWCIDKISTDIVLKILRQLLAIDNFDKAIESLRADAATDKFQIPQPNAVNYSLASLNSRLRFQIPLKHINFDATAVSNDILILSAIYLTVLASDMRAENALSNAKSEIRKIIGLIYDIPDKSIASRNNKIAENYYSQLKTIADKINLIFKKSLRLNKNNLNDFIKFSKKIENELSQFQLYNILIKPFDILAFSSDLDNSALDNNSLQTYAEKLRFTVKIKNFIAAGLPVLYND